MSTTIFHNPRCSKSRETLALLQSRGITPEVVLYLDTPPTAAELDTLLDQIGFADPRKLMRTKEAEYTELGLDNPGLSRDQLLAAMAAHPRLIERPIVIKDGRAVLGRPPENVLTLLG
jgi:arsenate reductase